MPHLEQAHVFAVDTSAQYRSWPARGKVDTANAIRRRWPVFTAPHSEQLFFILSALHRQHKCELGSLISRWLYTLFRNRPYILRALASFRQALHQWWHC